MSLWPFREQECFQEEEQCHWDSVCGCDCGCSSEYRGSLYCLIWNSRLNTQCSLAHINTKWDISTSSWHEMTRTCRFMLNDTDDLRQGGHVFAWVCLLSVCLSVSSITRKVVDGFGWQVITFCGWSVHAVTGYNTRCLPLAVCALRVLF